MARVIELIQNGVRQTIRGARKLMGRDDEPKVGRPTNDERHRGVLEDAMAEFNRIQSAMRDERLQCLEDRRFVSIAGAQWEGPLQEQFANKPKLEGNKIQLSLIRIFNEYRNNRIAANFATKDGSDSDGLTDACDGLYRADLQDSVANEAHDNAFDDATSGGFGAWMLRAAYEDEDNPDDEKQRIRIEPIFDADSSVFFDLDAKRQDKADAKHCFVLYSMAKQAYIDKYNDDPADWPKEIHQWEFDWATPDVVFIAKYYQVEFITTTRYAYRTLNGDLRHYTEDDLRADYSDGMSLREFLDATGAEQQGDGKRRKVRKVHLYLLTANKVLEDCGYIPGKRIPVVPMYGKRCFVDNVERTSGHVRIPKDYQRLENMQVSRLAEIAALSPMDVPIFTPEQMVGQTVMWAEANIKNYPYLLVNSVQDKDGNPMPPGPLGYRKAPDLPPALAAVLQYTGMGIKELTGNQEQAEQIQPNTSGVAVELVQNRIDNQSFIYMDNMAKAIKCEAEIWLSMAKEVYVTDGRKMKTIGEQSEINSIVLKNPVVSDDATRYENDLEEADFDVTVTVGPSSQSKRAATVRAMTGMMGLTDDPVTKKVLTSMVMSNMEGYGIDQDFRDYFRKDLIRLGVKKPTDEEAEELMAEAQNTPPDPQQKLLDAAAQEAEANAKSATASTILKVAQAGKTEAETEEARANAAATVAGIAQTDRQQAIDTAHTLGTLELDAAQAERDRAQT